MIKCNIVAQQLLGHTEEELCGWKVSDLLKGNGPLLEAYGEFFNNNKSKCELLNETMIAYNNNIKEKIVVDFICIRMMGHILILIKPFISNRG